MSERGDYRKSDQQKNAELFGSTGLYEEPIRSRWSWREALRGITKKGLCYIRPLLFATVAGIIGAGLGAGLGLVAYGLGQEYVAQGLQALDVSGFIKTAALVSGAASATVILGLSLYRI